MSQSAIKDFVSVLVEQAIPFALKREKEKLARTIGFWSSLY
jgi:hypothetical protein